MTHTLEFRDGIFYVKTSGEMDVEGFIAYYNDVLGNDKWVPGGKVIADHRELRGFTIDISKPFDKVSIVAEFFRQNEDRLGKAVLASVTPDRNAEVLVSLWDTVREYIKVDIHFRSFYEMEEAEEWIRSF